MPLDITFEIDINGLRQFADSFRQLGQHAHGIGSDVRSVGSNSTQDWGGRSGPPFRSVMSDFGGSADKVNTGAEQLAGGVDRYADGMNHVKGRIQQARNVAARAGLPTTNTQISEPGPGPGAPGPLSKDATPQQAQAHAAATQAQAAHQRQVKAYNEATQTLADARREQQQQDGYLQQLMGKDGVHSGIKATTTISGLAGSATGTTRALRARANEFYGKAAAESRIVDANLAKPGNPDDLADAIQRRSRLLTTANARSRDATSTVFRRQLDKLPKWAKAGLGNVGDEMRVTGSISKVAKPILKRVPIVGTAATAVTASIDTANGANPVKAFGGGILSLEAGTLAGGAVTSGMAGAASGTLAGTTIGETVGAAAGPVGIVAGAAVGAGVGLAVEHWDDITWGLGKATDWVGDRFSDVGSAIGSIF